MPMSSVMTQIRLLEMAAIRIASLRPVISASALPAGLLVAMGHSTMSQRSVTMETQLLLMVALTTARSRLVGPVPPQEWPVGIPVETRLSMPRSSAMMGLR